MSTVQPPISRRERKKAQRRRAIYETALELFTAKGYNAVSVEDITDAVDVSKGTFFNYFPTKEQILVEYRRALYDAMEAFAAKLGGTSGRELFRKYCRKRARLIQQEGERFLMVHRSLNVRPEIRALDQRPFYRMLEQYQRYARIALEAGEIAPDTDVELFAEMVLDLWVGNLLAWVNQPKTYSLEKRMVQKIDFLFQRAS